MEWSAACAEQHQRKEQKTKKLKKNWWLWNYDVLLMSYSLSLNWYQPELEPEPFYFGRVGAGAAENRAAPQLWLLFKVPSIAVAASFYIWCCSLYFCSFHIYSYCCFLFINCCSLIIYRCFLYSYSYYSIAIDACIISGAYPLLPVAALFFVLLLRVKASGFVSTTPLLSRPCNSVLYNINLEFLVEFFIRKYDD